MIFKVKGVEEKIEKRKRKLAFWETHAKNYTFPPVIFGGKKAFYARCKGLITKEQWQEARNGRLLSAKFHRMSHSFCYRKLLETIERICLRHGVELKKVHPAYTSVIGRLKYQPQYGMHIVSRNTDPLENLVVSVTKFIGGTAHNIIPGSVEVGGTVRSFDPKLRESVPGLMERIVKGITEAHGATYDFQYEFGYRPVINHEEVTQVIEETVREVLGQDALELLRPNMGGEDFSAFHNR